MNFFSIFETQGLVYKWAEINESIFIGMDAVGQMFLGPAGVRTFLGNMIIQDAS